MPLESLLSLQSWARDPQRINHETAGQATVIEIYTDATANGLKVSIGLEELKLEYKVHRVFLGGEQMTPEFTALNPNNKIPVLVDDDVVVSESGAILIYLAEKTGKLLPKEPRARIKTIEMVINQMASLGPMLGQLFVFRGAWQNKVPEVTDRYFKEVSRIYGVLNRRLEGRPYFAGNEYTIADIAFLPWIRGLARACARTASGPEGPDDPRAVPAGKTVRGLYQGHRRCRRSPQIINPVRWDGWVPLHRTVVQGNSK